MHRELELMNAIRTTIIYHSLAATTTQSPVLSFFFENPSDTAIDLFASLTQQLLRHMIAKDRPLPGKYACLLHNAER